MKQLLFEKYNFLLKFNMLFTYIDKNVIKQNHNIQEKNIRRWNVKDKMNVICSLYDYMNKNDKWLDYFNFFTWLEWWNSFYCNYRTQNWLWELDFYRSIYSYLPKFSIFVQNLWNYLIDLDDNDERKIRILNENKRKRVLCIKSNIQEIHEDWHDVLFKHTQQILNTLQYIVFSNLVKDEIADWVFRIFWLDKNDYLYIFLNNIVEFRNEYDNDFVLVVLWKYLLVLDNYLKNVNNVEEFLRKNVCFMCLVKLNYEYHRSQTLNAPWLISVLNDRILNIEKKYKENWLWDYFEEMLKWFDDLKTFTYINNYELFDRRTFRNEFLEKYVYEK